VPGGGQHPSHHVLAPLVQGELHQRPLAGPVDDPEPVRYGYAVVFGGVFLENTGLPVPGETALLAGADSGKNTPAVQALMTDLGNQITAITSETSGLSGTVLAYTPAQYDANHALLSPARASLAISRNDSKTARNDIATVVADLK